MGNLIYLKSWSWWWLCHLQIFASWIQHYSWGVSRYCIFGAWWLQFLVYFVMKWLQREYPLMKTHFNWLKNLINRPNLNNFRNKIIIILNKSNKCVSSNKLSIRHESKWDTSLNVKDFTKNFNFPHKYTNVQKSRRVFVEASVNYHLTHWVFSFSFLFFQIFYVSKVMTIHKMIFQIWL